MHLRVCQRPCVWVYLPVTSTPTAKATSFNMSDLILSFAAGQTEASPERWSHDKQSRLRVQV